MSRNIVLTLTLFLTANTIQNLYGQYSELPLNSLNQSKGLPNVFNMHFSTDKDGFFWTSSRNGLNQFDGEVVTVYKPTKEGKSIDLNISSTVFQDKQNNHWFTSSSALHCLIAETDSLKTWQFSNTSNSYHYAIHLERDSFLWMVANNQLYAINIHESIEEQPSIHPFETYLAFAAEDTLGFVNQLVRPIITTNGSGLERIRMFDDKLLKIDSIFLPPGNFEKITPFFLFLYIESSNSYWIPSNVGLIHLNPSQPENYQIYKHKPLKTVDYNDIAPWKDQYLWLASSKDGLLLFDKNSKSFIQQKNLFLIDNELKKIDKINKIHIDEQENLWCAIIDKGIFYVGLNNLKFEQLFPLKDFILDDKLIVNTISEHNKLGILAHVENKGLFSFPSNQKKKITRKFLQIILMILR